MRGSIRLFRISGIDINVHLTFFLLFLFAAPGGIKWIFLVVGIFFFVTVHELCHSLVAKHFGIQVREITLYPIGGIASMGRIPEKPSQEFLISIAGPMSNIVVLAVFFFPAKYLLGPGVLFHPLSTETWPLTAAYLYWINLILAGFNLIPAFPMDGGRILRSILAARIGFHKATKVAVTCGHIFALAFAYFGILRLNIMLVIIAVFIYTSASGEGFQVDVKETLKKFRVRDILPRDFITVKSDITLAKVLELVFHSHQEDFPVVDAAGMVGFLTRQDIMKGMHSHGMDKSVAEVMRKDFPMIKEGDALIKAQDIMGQSGMRSLPVVKDGGVVGVITMEDISRVYALSAQR